MTNPLSRTAAFVAYQLTVLLGIVLFPLAVIASKLGVRLPLERLLGWLDGSVDDTSSE